MIGETYALFMNTFVAEFMILRDIGKLSDILVSMFRFIDSKQLLGFVTKDKRAAEKLLTIGGLAARQSYN